MICRRAEALFWQSDGCLVVVLPLSWTRRELKSLCRLYATTDTTRSSIGPTLDVRLNRLCTAPTTATFVTKSRYVVPVPRSSHRQTDRHSDANISRSYWRRSGSRQQTPSCRVDVRHLLLSSIRTSLFATFSALQVSASSLSLRLAMYRRLGLVSV